MPLGGRHVNNPCRGAIRSYAQKVAGVRIIGVKRAMAGGEGPPNPFRIEVAAGRIRNWIVLGPGREIIDLGERTVAIQAQNAILGI